MLLNLNFCVPDVWFLMRGGDKKEGQVANSEKRNLDSREKEPGGQIFV